MENKQEPKTDYFKAVVEAPAVAMDISVEISKKIIQNKPVKVVKKYFSDLGPGIVTGAADDDLSGIIAYSQTGAKYGYGYLWMSLFSLPFMAVVQEMCARIGLVTGRGLAGVLRQHYSKKILYFCTLLLLVANTVNIGADIGAMAASSRLLLPQFSFSTMAIFFTIITLLLQIFIPFKEYSKYLKILTLSLMSYVITFFMVEHNWLEVLRGLAIPKVTFSQDSFYLIAGILGTTISPYLFFWEASHEVEAKIEEGQTSIAERQTSLTAKDIKNMRKDSWTGMSYSNIVMFFIIGLTGATLFKNGITNINSIADVAEALKPLAGENAALLFTTGAIGIGLLAIPVLAGSASYALSEAMGWKAGLNKTLHQAYGFYGIIIFSTIIGLMINYLGIDPIKANIFAAVLNGLAAPILIVFITMASSNQKIMGEWKNSKSTTVLASIIALIMGIVGLIVILGLFNINIFGN